MGDPPMADVKPTPRQEELLDVVRRFTADHGYPPTVREIRDGLGLNAVSRVARMLGQLREAGLIDWQDGLSRTIRVVDQP